MPPKNEVEVINKFTTAMTLPDGIKIEFRRAKNEVRRLIAQNPEERVESIFASIAAACLAKVTIPAGYDEGFDAELVREYAATDLEKPYNRMDDWSMCDSQAFVSAFELLNLPTKALVEQLADAVKKGKAAAK
jgi:hypothetical protein